METIGIILAAGGSRRMGTHKALLPVGGRPLLRCHVDALAAHVGAVCVGLGAEADRLAAALPAGVAIVENPDWARTTPRETLLAVLLTLPRAARLIVTPVDAPPAPPAVLGALLAAGAPAVPVFAGARGHPVCVDAAPLRAALRRGTLRDALRDAREVGVDWPDTARNLNTPSDWAAWTGSLPEQR